jgi:adenylate cyclase
MPWLERLSIRSPGAASSWRLRDLKLAGFAAGVMALLACLHLVALDVGWLRRLELMGLDLQMRLRGPRAPGPETVIVMIDDATIAELGRWPLPRAKLAEAITSLHRAGARAIGVDILFADREISAEAADGSGADALAQAIGEAGNVVLPFAFMFGTARSASKIETGDLAYTRLRKERGYRPVPLEPTGLLTPLPALAAHAALGHMLIAYDVDGMPRFDYPALEFDLDYYPSMAIRVAQLFLGVPWQDVTVDLGRGILLGSRDIPTDPQMRLLVNYLGPSPAFPTYSLGQVLSGAVAPETFSGRVVLVGANALGTRDTFESPFTAVMPGVERLATVVDSILHNRHLRRPAPLPWLEAAFMLAAAVALGVAVSHLSLAAAALCGLVLIATAVIVAQAALASGGYWIATTLPVIGIVLTFSALSLYRYGLLDKERRHIRRVFQRYLTPSMVDRLVRNPELPQLGGELRELTVLFCDLRGFTALSEALDPTTLARVINVFLHEATEAILEFGGTIDKYVGDAIMAFWNAPLDQPEHATLACRAALRILERLEAINAASASDDALPHLAAGIGINTGPCTVGNFGSNRRFDYSAVGDAVNVAARLEGETKTHGKPILIGPETATQAQGFRTVPVATIHVRGRTRPLQIHALVGRESSEAIVAGAERPRRQGVNRG